MYVLIVTIAMIWNIFLMAGTVYLIQMYNWSTWWLLLAVLLLANPKQDKDKGDTGNV